MTGVFSAFYLMTHAKKPIMKQGAFECTEVLRCRLAFDPAKCIDIVALLLVSVARSGVGVDTGTMTNPALEW